MKRVRYALGAMGAVGLAPAAALGMAAPQAAPATAHPVDAAAKSVRPDVTCVAGHTHTPFQANSKAGMSFYHRGLGGGNTCVGTVHAEIFKPAGPFTQVAVRVHANGHVHSALAWTCQQSNCFIPVRTEFHNLSKVCTSWSLNGGFIAKFCQKP